MILPDSLNPENYSLDDYPPEGFGFIYKITSPSGKSYIGQTVRDVSRRINRHGKESRCVNIHRAILKYGKDNFNIEILGIFLLELLDLAEISAIKENNTLSPNGYNLKEGGANGIPSEETRKKISEALKGKPISPERRLQLKLSFAKYLAERGGKMPPKTKEQRLKVSLDKKGKKHTEEHKAKIRAKALGRIRSEETKRKISESKKGINHPNYGKSRSLETRKKISESLTKNHPFKGKRHSEEAKRKISDTLRARNLSKEAEKKRKEQ